MSNILVNISLVTYGAIVLGLISLVIWWLIRKRRKRIWMPILRVLEIEGRPLPKLVLHRPPLLAFFCFLLALLCIVFLTMSPVKPSLSPLDPSTDRVHVFFDLSPSVSSTVLFSEYMGQAVQLIKRFLKTGQVTISHSASSEVFVVDSINKVEEVLGAAGFHRPGLRHRDTITNLLDKIKGTSLMVIFSDNDKYSWEGFNHSFLADDLEVRLYQVADLGKSGENIFFGSIAYSGESSGSLNEYDVEIMRRKSDADEVGNLRVFSGDSEIYVGTWNIPAGSLKVKIRVRWSTSLIKGIRGGRLKWVLEPENSDSIIMDNVFYTAAHGRRGSVLLVADHGGELFIDDPSYHLKKSLEVLGFDAERYDTWSDIPDGLAEKFPLWIVISAMDSVNLTQCPEVNYLKFMREKKIKPKIWLAPTRNKPNWRNLCLCHSQLLSFGKPSRGSYCNSVETRAQYIGVLKSIGSKQVGGQIGSMLNSVAWHYKSEKQPEIIAFSMPLKPSRVTGFSYASLPLTLKALASWQGLSADHDSEILRNQISSIAKIVEEKDFGKKVELSNVPKGESALKSISNEQLPLQIGMLSGLGSSRSVAAKSTKDPLPWLQITLVVLIFSCGFEVFGAAFIWVFRFFWNKKFLLTLMLLFLPWVWSSQMLAQVQINAVGFADFSARGLSREVASRTSISMDPDIINLPSKLPDVVTLPWIWSKNLSKFLGEDGKLKLPIIRWLKRGGFLVVENANDLKSLILSTDTNWFPDRGQQWTAIPPDHEVMRSFHLLETLPVCANEVWRGFQFDGRLAIVAIPGDFLETLVDQKVNSKCSERRSYEKVMRVFINIMMVALTTDYKKDQIHLPEILKRLR